ncbi:lipoprotein [Escherichia coli]|nr:lipoprotein [Escherichia coli]
MAYSVQKSRLAKVAGVSLVLLLAACSSDSRYKRQVSGDEAYLEAAPLAELHAPAGMILPVTSGDYAIPVTNGSGAVGKALDIRPPASRWHWFLARVPSSRAIPLHCWWKMVVAILCGRRWLACCRRKTTPSPNVMMLVRH